MVACEGRPSDVKFGEGGDVVDLSDLPVEDDMLVMGSLEGGPMVEVGAGGDDTQWAHLQICYPKSKWVLNWCLLFDIW